MRLRIAKCERCGKPLAVAAQSILGLDALKASFPVLCSDCTTPEEVYLLAVRQGRALVGGEA